MPLLKVRFPCKVESIGRRGPFDTYGLLIEMDDSLIHLRPLNRRGQVAQLDLALPNRKAIRTAFAAGLENAREHTVAFGGLETQSYLAREVRSTGLHVVHTGQQVIIRALSTRGQAVSGYLALAADPPPALHQVIEILRNPAPSPHP